MKYFIFKDSEFIETDEAAYNQWYETEMEKCLHPDVDEMINGIQHSIYTYYEGRVQEGENLMPFQVVYYEGGFITIHQKMNIDLTDLYGNDKEEYYDNYEEFTDMYLELVELVKQKKKASGN